MTKKKTDDRFRAGQTAENGRPICGAKKKDGNPCGASPKKGFTRCVRHGGNSPRAKAAAKRRNAETAAREILGTIDPDAPREHPVETLLNLIQAKAAEVQWLRTIIKEMTEEQLTWGIAQHRDGFGPEGIIDEKTYKAEMNVWWKTLREAENQLAQWTAAAAKAGVEERAVTLAEDQALQLVTAINRILAQLQLTSDQQRMTSTVIPAVLREIGEGKTT
jgi:hypothetical protein